MKKKKCMRCGHEWVARIDKPRYCPKCRSIYWDIERKEKKGIHLTYVYQGV